MWTPLPDPFTRGLWTSHGLGLPIQLKYPPLCFVPAPLAATVRQVGSTVLTPAGAKMAVLSTVVTTPYVTLVAPYSPVAAYTPNPVESTLNYPSGPTTDPGSSPSDPPNELGGC